MTELTLADPWVARLDRLRRRLPLPLLAGSTAVTLTVSDSSQHPWARVPIGLPLVAASALLWTVATFWPAAIATVARSRVLFTVHTGLVAVLVWVGSAFGVFAYMGFLFAYRLGPRWRTAGFTATSLVVAASLTDGYPNGRPGQTLGYVLISAVLLVLVLNSSITTARAIEQNHERGRIIAENAALQAQLVAQAKEAGVVEERQRLAGEIHDTIAQGLTGIVAQLQAAEQTRHRPEELRRHLRQARDLARASLTEARRSVRALRPEQLEDATLGEAIGELVHGWSQRVAVPAELDTTGAPARADADVEAAVFRVAQEALTNVAKHSGASAVRLTLTYLDDTLLLDIHDNGTGFDPGSPTDGYGLLGMRRRLAGVGGTLTVESTDSYGTTVNAAVPLGGNR